MAPGWYTARGRVDQRETAEFTGHSPGGWAPHETTSACEGIRSRVYWAWPGRVGASRDHLCIREKQNVLGIARAGGRLTRPLLLGRKNATHDSDATAEGNETTRQTRLSAGSALRDAPRLADWMLAARALMSWIACRTSRGGELLMRVRTWPLPWPRRGIEARHRSFPSSIHV